MDIGMLWFDNNPQTDLQSKVARAAAYYQKKYGQTPNLCFVHPSMLNGEHIKVDAVELRKLHSVLPNHFWLGINTTST